MSETSVQILVYATVSSAVLLALLLVVALRISGKLARVERRLAMAQDEQQHAFHPGELLEERKATTREQKDLFQQFLAEDPKRRNLPKKEQFEGFRRWRQERGLNWQG